MRLAKPEGLTTETQRGLTAATKDFEPRMNANERECKSNRRDQPAPRLRLASADKQRNAEKALVP